MATIKLYTDLEQSKKLTKILPLESADFGWNVFVDGTSRILPISDWDLTKDGSNGVKFFHAWSLAALLGVLPIPSLHQTKDKRWYCNAEPNRLYFSEHHNNPVDACVDMIEKLHELKML